jgi:two-component system, LytTR family, response regulator
MTTMRILILEDEPPAMEQLVLAVKQYSPEVEIAGTFGSVREAASALAKGISVDLLLADIHLSDTTSLRLWDQAAVACPVVFVTAYDAYLLQAFERGAIDYVLKPIDQDRLSAALDKYLRLRAHFTGRVKEALAELSAPTAAKGKGGRFKERILARRGMDLLAVPVPRVAWFMSEHRLTMVCEKGGARHMVDETLGELEEALDPRRFFRLNRQFLAQVDAITSFRSVGKGRLGVTLEPRPDDDVVVSQERAAEFRDWMEGR